MKKNDESFEGKLDDLASILKIMESGDLSLSESLDKFEKGIRLYSSCLEILENANNRVSIIKADFDSGEYELEPFDVKEE